MTTRTLFRAAGAFGALLSAHIGLSNAFPPEPIPQPNPPAGFIAIGQWGGGARTAEKINEAIARAKTESLSPDAPESGLRPLYYAPCHNTGFNNVTSSYAKSRGNAENPPAHVYIYAKRKPSLEDDLFRQTIKAPDGSSMESPYSGLTPFFQVDADVRLSDPHLITAKNDSTFFGSYRRLFAKMTDKDNS